MMQDSGRVRGGVPEGVRGGVRDGSPDGPLGRVRGESLGRVRGGVPDEPRSRDPQSGAIGGDAAASAYPSDPRDGWEPGAPSLRAVAPSAIGGAVVPLAVYYLVRGYVGGDAPALAIAGVPAALWVSFEWVRRRKIDPIGAIVLFGFIAGLLVSYALGGSAFVLKVRDSAFTALFGLGCLASLRFGRRPMMFTIGRALSAGDDPVRRDTFDRLWELPSARAIFTIITLVWSVGLLFEAAGRVLLALVLPTGLFLAVSPFNAAVWLGGLFAFTVWFSRWGRNRAEHAVDLVYPEGGGTAWWWMGQFRNYADLSQDAPGLSAIPDGAECPADLMAAGRSEGSEAAHQHPLRDRLDRLDTVE